MRRRLKKLYAVVDAKELAYVAAVKAVRLALAELSAARLVLGLEVMRELERELREMKR
jgi:hypothetical protein